MSLACGLPLLECIYRLVHAWKRASTGYHDSATEAMPPPTFAPVRGCAVMANYEPDLAASLDPPMSWRHTYADIGPGHAYCLLDLAARPQPRGEVRLRLLDNRLGKCRRWRLCPQRPPPPAGAFDKECDCPDLLDVPDYTLTFTGHSSVLSS
ncbi:hypothetical protein ZWY2020_023249 [Hordeum vulgare]|nr:hypothetical protein ZWY2020_023249 [Hordeum vulgare]